MATIDAAPALHRLSFDDVVRMSEAGIIGPDQRVELLDGLLIDMSPPGPRHEGLVARLNRRLVEAAGEALEVRVQGVLRLGAEDFVLPDLMLVDAGLGLESYPTTAVLVVEIAVISQQHDRSKASRYAAVGVAEYWLVDVAAGVVLVHREPGSERYGAVTEHRDGTLTPLLGVPDIPVALLLRG